MIAARCTCHVATPPDLRPSEALARFVADLLAHGAKVRTIDAKTAKKMKIEAPGWASLQMGMFRDVDRA